MEKKKIDFSIGIFDEISSEIENKIKKEASQCEVYGVGVYTDEMIIEKYRTYPRKSIKERIELVKKIEGVDFVFQVDTKDLNKIKEIIGQEYRKLKK